MWAWLGGLVLAALVALLVEKLVRAALAFYRAVRAELREGPGRDSGGP